MILSFYWLGGGFKPQFRLGTKVTHPHMRSRKELNIHMFGHRLTILWGRIL